MPENDISEAAGDYIREAGADLTCIAPRLWMGAAPDPEPLRKHGFEAVVFCAEEFQPDADRYEGLATHFEPMADDGRTCPDSDRFAIVSAARFAHDQWRHRGRRVAITCLAGRNRSGVVMALTLAMLTNDQMPDVIAHVRHHRLGALSNPGMARMAQTLGLGLALSMGGHIIPPLSLRDDQ